MSTKWFFATRLIYAAIFSLTLASVNAHATNKTIKLEAQLVYGTNEAMTNARPFRPRLKKNSRDCRSSGAVISSSARRNFP